MYKSRSFVPFSIPIYPVFLSRAFAICLKNDATFLSFILKNILEEKIYSQAFSNEYPNSFIDIDLQQKVNYLSSYTYIYAVACSGLEINEKEIQKVKSRTTDNPETDLLIKIGDIHRVPNPDY